MLCIDKRFADLVASLESLVVSQCSGAAAKDHRGGLNHGAHHGHVDHAAFILGIMCAQNIRMVRVALHRVALRPLTAPRTRPESQLSVC
jgi:hypothetical protein